jgi:hypothetical protein
MTSSKTPSKPWRVITDANAADYSSERKAYDALNALARIGTAAIGVKVTVRHWEHGRWALYERAVITENGWESA